MEQRGFGEFEVRAERREADAFALDLRAMDFTCSEYRFMAARGEAQGDGEIGMKVSQRAPGGQYDALCHRRGRNALSLAACL